MVSNLKSVVDDRDLPIPFQQDNILSLLEICRFHDQGRCHSKYNIFVAEVYVPA